jgi:hypothetical protein
VVRARSGDVCEGCDAARAFDWAHRDHSGPWAAGNGLDLCRSCHDWAHHNPLGAEGLGWIIPRDSDYLTTRVAHSRFGWVYLLDDGSVRPAYHQIGDSP